MQNRRILLVKTGASGDVVRTSTLLHLYQNDQVVWISKGANCDLLPQELPNLSILDIDQAAHQDLGHFDLVISLDDELSCAQLATKASKDKLVGAYVDDGKVLYSEDSSEWFDMGLISKFGKQQADEIKKQNTASVQEILFRMMGHVFAGEEYLIREDVPAKPQAKLVGIENRAGDRWPTKCWDKYEELADQLRDRGFRIRFFEQRDHLKDYIQDISECSIFISGDTLGMHLALALKIPSVALFTCTSSTEIYGYQRMKKIVSSKLMDAFYTREYRQDVLDAITVDEVLDAILSLESQNPN
ncbi:MAG: glycosyltransferase family 9 protein [Bacteroidota bacterium]